MLQINKTTTKQKMYVESCVGEKIMKQNNNNEQNDKNEVKSKHNVQHLSKKVKDTYKPCVLTQGQRLHSQPI